MGAFITVIDTVLFIFFVAIAVVTPLLDSQTCLPISYFPDILVNIKKWYMHKSGDYLFLEKPAFFLGLIWFEILFQCPLAILNIYAILASKNWFNTTCLISGVSTFTSMVVVMAEVLSSGKASDNMLKLYFSYFGYSVLAILRGLLPCTTSSGRKAPQPSKKNA